MMLARTFDAEHINALVNDPDVRPHVGLPAAGPLDLTAVLAIDANVFLTGLHGGFGLIWTAPRCFEVHTFILPSGRGAWGYAAAREMIATMRDDHAALHLWTRIAPEARATRTFARANGMRPAMGADPLGYDLFEWRAA